MQIKYAVTLAYGLGGIAGPMFFRLSGA